MKKNKVIMANIISAVLLAGCSTGADINDVVDETYNTNISTSTILIQHGETNMNNKNTTTSIPQQLSTSTSGQPEQNPSASTQTQKSEQHQTSAETSTPKSTEIYESEFIPETVPEDTDDLFPDEITVYYDKNSGKDFIMLNVTLNKIYWNELDEYSVTEGQTIDIPIPAIFEDWVSDADEIMIYMSSNSKTFGDLSLDSEKKIKGMTYPQYWSTDYLCPIKNGIVCFGEYTDNINNSFSRVDDGVYIEEANYQYSENPFENNMSVSDLDIYFDTIKEDYDALMQTMAENPDTNYDIAGFWGYQDGIRFRATINNIY